MAKNGKMGKRAGLTRESVLRAAIEVADADGLESLSMRKLGQVLGVAGMSLYNHVAHREDIIDGIVDIVFSEMELPAKGGDWKAAMRRRCVSAREVLSRHPWATPLMESRLNPGLASLRHHEAVIGCFREAGFSVALAAHAFSALDSYTYGFALQEKSLPFQTPEELEVVAAHMMNHLPAGEFPYLIEMMVEHILKVGYSYANEFEFGLELILDGLEKKQREALSTPD